MEILKHGKTYRLYSCKECHCAFSITKSDVRTDDFANEYITCPECGHVLAISPKEFSKE